VPTTDGRLTAASQ